jgi:hypothetical protein
MVDSVRRRLAVTLLPLLLVLACTASPGSALPPPITVVTGQSAGWPDVRGFDRSGGQALQIAPWGTNPLAFSAYSTYQYGVRVAVGDVNGDGTSEIVIAPGKGAWTELRVDIRVPRDDQLGRRHALARRCRRASGGSYLVRSAKRYAKRGRYEITVTLMDSSRVSIAHSTAIVRR